MPGGAEPYELPDVAGAQTMEQNKDEGAGLRQVAAQWSRTKWISFTKGLLISCLAVGLLFLAYVGLFEWNITSVPTRVMQVSDISQLKDGRIAYHVKMTDGYHVNLASYDTDEEGNFYVTPKRPIIKSKNSRIWDCPTCTIRTILKSEMTTRRALAMAFRSRLFTWGRRMTAF